MPIKTLKKCTSHPCRQFSRITRRKSASEVAHKLASLEDGSMQNPRRKKQFFDQLQVTAAQKRQEEENLLGQDVEYD